MHAETNHFEMIYTCSMLSAKYKFVSALGIVHRI